MVLYVVTAVAEILGCYLILLFSKQPARWWLIPLALIALTAFGGLLRLHPQASGRLRGVRRVYIATAFAHNPSRRAVSIGAPQDIFFLMM